MDKALKDFPNNGGLILLDQEKFIVCMVKAVKRNFDFVSGFKPLPDTPLYILGNAPALLLREGGHDCQDHLRKGILCVNSFLFKINLYTVFLQFPYRLKGVNRVPGESADALGNDVVDFSGFAILDHLLELDSAL